VTAFEPDEPSRPTGEAPFQPQPPDGEGDESTRPERPLELATRSIHGGMGRAQSGAPVVMPLYQSATFHGGGPGDEGELRYSRYGNNPNQELVGDRVALLEGMEAGLAVGSGMAAIALTLLSLVRTGDHVVTSDRLYGATRLFMEEELPRRGVEVGWVDPENGERGWRDALRPRTRLLYLETPTNPTLRVHDPRVPAAVAREQRIPLVMDVTFASPMNFRAGEWGAEVAIHSATKYLGGHSDLIAGVVTGPRARIEEIQRMLRLYGPALDPHAAWLLDRGLRTLDVRIERHNRNALSLARWFQGRPGVDRVIYPGLPSHPDHELATRLLDGYGGMLGVELSGGVAATEGFCRSLRLAALAPSLGGVETLVSLPRLTSHRSMDAGARRAAGIGDGLVRISVGLEGLEDLTGEFERALAGARSASSRVSATPGQES